MHRIVIRIKGFGNIVWHTKHELFHVVLGLLWLMILRSVWQEEAFLLWTIIAIVGSLLPDVDHLLYFFTYGKKDLYTRTIFSFIKRREWNVLISFIETGHKHNTNLAFHNVYVVCLLIVSTYIMYLYQYQAVTVLLGAMVSHFLFDIAEDFLLLGSLNKNWMRFGRPKKYLQT